MARTPTELSEERQAALDHAKAKYGEFRKSRRTALERAKLAAEAEVAERRREAAKAVLAAYQAGVPMRHIGRTAMRTTDYATVRALIGEVDLDALKQERIDEMEQAKELQQGTGVELRAQGGGVYRIALSGAELEQATEWANWDSSDVPVQYRSMEAAHNNGLWGPITPGWIAEVSEEHPVVVWLTKPTSRDKLNELLEGL